MKKYDIILAKFDGTKGYEIRGIRPCVVVQNNIANSSKLGTVAVAPCSSILKYTATGVFVHKSKKNGFKEDSRVELAHIRSIDRSRIVKSLGILEEQYRLELREKLIHFFDIDDEF